MNLGLKSAYSPINSAPIFRASICPIRLLKVYVVPNFRTSEKSSMINATYSPVKILVNGTARQVFPRLEEAREPLGNID